MARRKAEVQLQQVIETQEEWEDMLGKEGLFVVDIYQEWSGTTSCLVANLRRLKNELGDDLLHFAVAKADTIDALEKYRGHCEPCFLFFAGGVLVAVVRGANSPKVLRTITEQLQQEHKVMDGQSERKEIKDPFIAQMESAEQLEDEEEKEEEEEGKKEVTVCLIKPDAVQQGKVPEIIADIEARGIEILKNEERTLTEDEVKQFYSHLQEESFFEDFVKFMTSGSSHVLVLTKGRTGENIISEFRDLIGPTDVEEAKEQQPESLRAKYGEKNFMNALHGSSSEDMAMRELAFFFPDYVLPAAEGKPKLQRTLALIRPDAFKNNKDEIIASINEAGFKVALQKEMQLTREMAEDFYKEHKGQEYFEELMTRMTSGPVLALGLAREDAVEGWRNMLGPTDVAKAKEEAPDSLRAKFAIEDTAVNMLHGSDTEEAAKKELEFFFPMEQTVAVIKPDAVGTKDEIIDKIHESGFKIAARKETTLSREVAEEFYADHKDKEYYEELVEHMISGPTYFMVLSREDAVQGWRSIIGPTDPEKAKEESPDSLRAAYGKNVLQNAVHGSSSKEHAVESLKKIFGDLTFSPDGTVREEEPEDGQKKEEVAESEEQEEAIQSEEPIQKAEQDEEKPSESKPESSETTEQATEEKKPEETQQEESKPEEQKSEEQQEESKQEEVKEEPKEEAKPEEEQKTEEEQKPDEPKQEEEKTEEAPKEEEKPEEPKQEETQEESKPEEEKKEEQQETKPEEPEQKTEETPAEEKKEEEKKEEEQAKSEEKPDDKPAEEG